MVKDFSKQSLEKEKVSWTEHITKELQLGSFTSSLTIVSHVTFLSLL